MLDGVPWRLVRLEHAPTGVFPAGSATRAYLLRVPLNSNGHIDPLMHAVDQRRATMRRFWPSEPDRSGYIVREEATWHFIVTNNGPQTDDIAWFEDCALRIGRMLEIIELANGPIPFRVAAIRPD